MNTAAQAAQPVPLYYGELQPATPVVVALSNQFDWVLTAMWGHNDDAAAWGLTVGDENSVRLFALGANNTGAPTDQMSAWAGEAPIGPRAGLTLECFLAPVYLYIGGYALTPPSALHV